MDDIHRWRPAIIVQVVSDERLRFRLWQPLADKVVLVQSYSSNAAVFALSVLKSFCSSELQSNDSMGNEGRCRRGR